MLKSYPLSILFLAAQHHRLGSSSACNIFYHVSVGSVFLLPFFPLLTLQWLYFLSVFLVYSVYICLDLAGGFLLNGTDEMRMKMHA